MLAIARFADVICSLIAWLRRMPTGWGRQAGGLPPDRLTRPTAALCVVAGSCARRYAAEMLRGVLSCSRFGVLALICACTPTAAPSAGPREPVITQPEITTPTPVRAPVEATPATPAEPGLSEVEGRVLETGPLGHGRCVQQSYKIEVTHHIRGEVLASPGWIHFERCEGAPSDVEAGGLAIGATRRFTLKRGASSNFPGEPMITGLAPV